MYRFHPEGGAAPFRHRSPRARAGRRLPVVVLTLLLLLGPALAAQAQDIIDEMRQVNRVFSIRDGLPQTSAYDLEVDARGWLWVVTQNGVAFHNGRRWQTTEDLNRAIKSGFWTGRRVLSDGQGRLWFATQGDGLYRLDVTAGLPPERWPWVHINRGEGLASDTVLYAHKRADGSLWFFTPEAISIFDGAQWKTMPPPAAPSGQAHLVDVEERPDGSMWVGLFEGLFALQRGQWTPIPLPEALRGRPVRSILQRRDGSVWVAVTGGLASWRQGVWKVHELPPYLRDPALNDLHDIIDLFEHENGTLWVSLNLAGVAILHADGSWQRLSVENGLPSNEVHTVTGHPDGSVWIGTHNGIAVRNSSDWVALDRAAGLADDDVWAILERRDGTVWLGTSSGLEVLSPQGRRHIAMPARFGKVRTLYEDPQGVLWIGFRWGLARYHAGRLDPIDIKQYVYTLTALRDGSLLAGTTQGIFRIEGRVFKRLPFSDPLIERAVKAIYEGNDGSLWVGVEGQGLAHYAQGRWRLFTPEDGLPGTSVLHISESSDGLLWVATTKGVGAYDGHAWRLFNDTTGVRLPDRFAYNVLQDGAGRYYIATNQGVARLTPHPDDVRRGTPLAELRFNVETFGLDDGLPNLEANQGAALRDRRGRIWLGTITGIALYDPTREQQQLRPRPIQFDRIAFSGLADSVLAQAMRSQQTLRLKHRSRDVTFSFAMSTPGKPESVHYQTQLLGYDEAPSPWSSAFSRTYTNLPSGSYVFEVVGRTPNGQVSETKRFAFSVAPPPWRTPWAFFLYGFAVLGALGGLLHVQSVRTRRRQVRVAAMERERYSRSMAEAQAAAAEAQAALLRSENRRLAEANEASAFRQRVLEATTNAIFALDLEGRLTLFNQQTQRVTGLPAAALVERPLGSLFEAEAATRFKAAFERTLHSDSIVRDVALSYRLPGSDTLRHLVLTLSPLRVDGRLSGVVGTAEDVTKERELEQFRDDMIGMLVHDLRGPLAIVQMVSLELMQDEAMGPEMHHEMLELVFRNSRDALDLVSTMLDLWRLEAGRMPVKPEPASLRQTLAGIHDSMAPVLRERAIAVHTPDDDASVLADVGLLRRVLYNLLSNALKFSPPESAIGVRWHAHADHLQVRVIDAGPGIAPEVQTRLFEKYSTGEAKQSGTGLGLAFCRLAVEAMGGRLWLAETGAGGSTFAFTLPLAAEAVLAEA